MGRMRSLRKLNYFLIGQPGAGKSTLGAQLAARLKVDFVDIDRDVLEADFGGPVAKQLVKLGHDGFMEAEAAATSRFLDTLTPDSDTVVSMTGTKISGYFAAHCFWCNTIVTTDGEVVHWVRVGLGWAFDAVGDETGGEGVNCVLVQTLDGQRVGKEAGRVVCWRLGLGWWLVWRVFDLNVIPAAGGRIVPVDSGVDRVIIFDINVRQAKVQRCWWNGSGRKLKWFAGSF